MYEIICIGIIVFLIYITCKNEKALQNEIDNYSYGNNPKHNEYDSD